MKPFFLLTHFVFQTLDQNYTFILEFCHEETTLKHSGACQERATPPERLSWSAWWARLGDGTGCVSFPVGQRGTADTLCTLARIPTTPTPPTHPQPNVTNITF